MVRRQALGSACALLIACGTSVDLGGSAGPDGGTSDGPFATCPGYAAPDVPSKCRACTGAKCQLQPNGCYGSYYCRVSNYDCQPARVACRLDDGGH